MSTEPPAFLTWQVFAVIISIVIAGSSGVVQLASVQTAVTYNTNRLDNAETSLRDFRSRLAKTDDFQSQLDKLASNIEARRNESATTTAIQQLLNTTRLEFLAEIKRLDQRTNSSMPREEFIAWKVERDSLITTVLKRIETLEGRK